MRTYLDRAKRLWEARQPTIDPALDGASNDHGAPEPMPVAAGDDLRLAGPPVTPHESLTPGALCAHCWGDGKIAHLYVVRNGSALCARCLRNGA
jgi:hypothetical protein